MNGRDARSPGVTAPTGGMFFAQDYALLHYADVRNLGRVSFLGFRVYGFKFFNCFIEAFDCSECLWIKRVLPNRLKEVLEISEERCRERHLRVKSNEMPPSFLLVRPVCAHRRQCRVS